MILAFSAPLNKRAIFFDKSKIALKNLDHCEKSEVERQECRLMMQLLSQFLRLTWMMSFRFDSLDLTSRFNGAPRDHLGEFRLGAICSKILEQNFFLEASGVFPNFKLYFLYLFSIYDTHKKNFCVPSCKFFKRKSMWCSCTFLENVHHVFL